MARLPARFADTARDRIKNAESFWNNWRAQARKDFRFIAGKQWEEADENKLRAQKRPPITFNYSEKMIDAVVGAEISNRRQVTYLPRHIDAAGEADLWNAAAKWAREECNASDEEGDAFRDMLICGLGWTETSINYDEDQDGKIAIDRIDPLEMRSDPAATKPGLTDRRFCYRKWYVDESEAKQRWGNRASFTNIDDTITSTGVITHNDRYKEGEFDEAERHRNQVLITCYECVERVPIYRAAVGGQIQELSAQDYADMKDHLDEANVKTVKQFKNVYYRAYFSGETLLEGDLSPCQRGFMYQAITGKRDQETNTWYGLTRVMEDPQRWANKWLSQILHIINTNAKGGLLAEQGAFIDIKKAQEEWSMPDSITLLREGALASKRVQEKSMTNFPAGLDKLMQFALGSLPMVTGINLEALGLANRDQPGVLESQRKQAAYGLLSPLFNALANYRKNQGHVLLHLINDFIADGRLIRIGGADTQQYMPLAKTPGALEYDIIVDEAPDAPDVKQATWESLMQLVPVMMKEGLPVPPEVLDYAPIPASLAATWKQYIAQNKQVMSPEQIQQMQQEMQQLQQQNQQLQADNTAEMQKVQAEIQVMWEKLQLEMQKTQAMIQIKQQESQTKNVILAQQGQQQLAQDAEQHDQQMRLQEEQGTQQIELAQQQADNQHKVAMKKASMKPATAKPKGKSNG